MFYVDDVEMKGKNSKLDTHVAHADDHKQLLITNSCYRPCILRMYAARKRNQKHNRDGEVGTIQKAGIIKNKHDEETQQ